MSEVIKEALKQLMITGISISVMGLSSLLIFEKTIEIISKKGK